MAATLPTPAQPTAKLYIEVDDLKQRYQNPKKGMKRLRAYIRSLEASRKLWITVNKKEGTNIVEFVFEQDEETRLSREALREAKEDLQGEVCSPEAVKKYKKSPHIIPSVHIQHKKVSSEACKAISLGEQTALQTSVPKPRTLTVEALEQHDQKETSGPCELRQFACSDCNHSWWRMVLKTKPVSRCRGSGGCGSIRYDALPRDKEFGIGRCICPNTRCKRKFYAYCEATDEFKCRKCKYDTLCKPYIHPRWRKRRAGARLNPGAKPFRPRPNYSRDRDPQPAQFRSQGGSQGPNFYPESQERGGTAGYYTGGEGEAYYIAVLQDSVQALQVCGDKTPPPPPPPSQRQPRNQPKQKRRIFNASQPHESDGGTMTTFLTQVDFEKTGEEVVLDYDSDDDEERVGACTFECDCKHQYGSRGRMQDQAPCFKCGQMNSPLSWDPRNIRRKTDAKHFCSRCMGKGNCPNLQQINYRDS